MRVHMWWFDSYSDVVFDFYANGKIVRSVKYTRREWESQGQAV